MSNYFKHCEAFKKAEVIVDFIALSVFIFNIYLLFSNKASFMFCAQLFLVTCFFSAILSIIHFPPLSMFSVAVEGRGKKELRKNVECLLKSLFGFGFNLQITGLLIRLFVDSEKTLGEVVYGFAGVSTVLLLIFYGTIHDSTFYSKRELLTLVQTFALLVVSFIVLHGVFGILIHAFFI